MRTSPTSRHRPGSMVTVPARRPRRLSSIIELGLLRLSWITELLPRRLLSIIELGLRRLSRTTELRLQHLHSSTELRRLFHHLPTTKNNIHRHRSSSIGKQTRLRPLLLLLTVRLLEDMDPVIPTCPTTTELRTTALDDTGLMLHTIIARQSTVPATTTATAMPVLFQDMDLSCPMTAGYRLMTTGCLNISLDAPPGIEPIPTTTVACDSTPTHLTTPSQQAITRHGGPLLAHLHRECKMA